MHEVEWRELIGLYESSDEPELSEAGELLWSLVVEQGVQADAPRVLDYLLGRLERAAEGERLHTMKGLEVVLQSCDGEDVELDRAVMAVGRKHAEVLRRVMDGGCVYAESEAGRCDLHYAAAHVGMMLGLDGVEEALLRQMRADYGAHEDGWGLLAEMEAWPRLSDEELERCYQAGRREGWIAVCVLLARGAEAGRRLYELLIEAEYLYFNPSRECAWEIYRAPEKVGLEVLREMYRRASEPLALELLAGAILRVVAGDRRTGWMEVVEERDGVAVRVRHPGVARYEGEVDGRVREEVEQLRKKTRLQAVDTDLWGLFGV